MVGKWASELPDVQWPYRMTTRNSNGETPFALAFGTKMVITSEVAILIYRISQPITDDNDRVRREGSTS